MTILYPRDTLPPRSVMADIVPATISGGRSLTSIDQVIASDAGYWQIDFKDVPCVRPDQKRQARALSARANGRMNRVEVPIYVDTSTAPINIRPVFLLTHFSDGTFFSDGTSFSETLISATTVGVTALGATTIVVTLPEDAGELSGVDFSVFVMANRLYRITDIVSSTPHIDGSVTYSLKITPPVREAIPDGTTANFADPHCTCKLATDTEMQSFTDDYAGRGMGNISFVEALP